MNAQFHPRTFTAPWSGLWSRGAWGRGFPRLTPTPSSPPLCTPRHHPLAPRPSSAPSLQRTRHGPSARPAVPRAGRHSTEVSLRIIYSLFLKMFWLTQYLLIACEYLCAYCVCVFSPFQSCLYPTLCGSQTGQRRGVWNVFGVGLRKVWECDHPTACRTECYLLQNRTKRDKSSAVLG